MSIQEGITEEGNKYKQYKSSNLWDNNGNGKTAEV